MRGDEDMARAMGAPGARMRFEELVRRYVQPGEGSGETTGHRVDFWVKHLSGRSLMDVTSADVERLLDLYQKEGGTTVASRNRMRANLSSMFRYARRKQLYSGNPCNDVAITPGEVKRTRWLDADEMQRLLAVAKQSSWDKLYLLILMGLSTGARAGELVDKLTWQSIDWKERTAVVRDTKNGTDRTLTFTAELMAELMRFRPKAGTAVAGGLVFGREEEPGRAVRWWSFFKGARRKAKLGDFRFHDLRHTTASLMVSAGESLYTVGQVLGHKSPQSTARYSHLSVEAKQKATDRVLGAALRKAMLKR